MMRGLFMLFCISAMAVTPTNFNNRVASTASIPWQGIAGFGVPRRTTVFASVTASPYNADRTGVTNASAAIQSAINACPSNQVVFIPPGRYKLTNALSITTSISLRGAGTIANMGSNAATILDATFIIAKPPNYHTIGIGPGSAYGTSSNITNTVAALYSTNVGVASTNGFTVGSFALLDELNDGTLVSISGIDGDCTFCSRANGTRALEQVVQITAITNKTLYFTPNLFWSYTNSLTPQATPFTSFLSYAGMESLTVIHDTNVVEDAVFYMEGCYRCWLKDVESIYASSYHIEMVHSLQCEVRDSYFHESKDTTSGSGYGVFAYYGPTACLIENNIFYNLHSPMQQSGGPAGCAWAYNYTPNLIYFDGTSTNTQLYDLAPAHGAHPIMGLWEGNKGMQTDADFTHGTSSHQTFMRNALRGHQSFTQYSLRAVIQDERSWYYNYIGNVLGDATATWTNGSAVYQTVAPASSGYSTPIIWRFGYTSTGDQGGGGSDTNVLATTLRAGNYDYQSNSNLWDSAVGDHTIPNSYLYGSTPSWWGDLPWPPIGSDLAVKVGVLPAERRFNGGQPPGPERNLKIAIIGH